MKYDRIASQHGFVHVLYPDNPNETIIYIHGYYTNVDGAWSDYQLADLFQAVKSHNATYIAIEAPKSNQETPLWTSLDALLSFIASQGVPVKGSVTAIVHSGGFTTVLKWIDNPRLARVILLDALYGGFSRFKAYPGILDIIGVSTYDADTVDVAKARNAEFIQGIPAVFDTKVHTILVDARRQRGHYTVIGDIPVILDRIPGAISTEAALKQSPWLIVGLFTVASAILAGVGYCRYKKTLIQSLTRR